MNSIRSDENVNNNEENLIQKPNPENHQNDPARKGLKRSLSMVDNVENEHVKPTKFGKKYSGNEYEEDENNIPETKVQDCPPSDSSCSCDSNINTKMKVTKFENDSIVKSEEFLPSANDERRKVYGLRPRSALRRLWVDETQEEQHPVAPGTSSSTTPEPDLSEDSNSSRPPTSDRLHEEDRPVKSLNNSKSKNRHSRNSKPLSKYRRITANARERDRMKEINTAFATLRGVLPNFANCRIANMTKYSTLQLAVSYIKGLSELLNETSNLEKNGSSANVKREVAEQGRIAACSGTDVSLSVGISEYKCTTVTSECQDQKPSDYVMLSNSSSFNFSDETLQGFDDIENLPEMRWALDLMMD